MAQTPSLPEKVLQDLSLYLSEKETIRKVLSPVAGSGKPLGELWVVQTDHNLFFHTRELGKESVVALLPRAEIQRITYFQHPGGVTLTFVPSRYPRNTTRVSFPKEQKRQVESFCEDLADLIDFKTESPPPAPDLLDPRPVTGEPGSVRPLDGAPASIRESGSETAAKSPPEMARNLDTPPAPLRGHPPEAERATPAGVTVKISKPQPASAKAPDQPKPPPSNPPLPPKTAEPGDTLDAAPTPPDPSPEKPRTAQGAVLPSKEKPRTAVPPFVPPPSSPPPGTGSGRSSDSTAPRLVYERTGVGIAFIATAVSVIVGFLWLRLFKAISDS